MMTFNEVLFWTPFLILGFATALYVILSWRHWFPDRRGRHPAE
jgi:hypothetical protein